MRRRPGAGSLRARSLGRGAAGAARIGRSPFRCNWGLLLRPAGPDCRGQPAVASQAHVVPLPPVAIEVFAGAGRHVDL